MKKKEKQTISKRISKSYKLLDTFGESVGFTVDGSATHRTCIGSFVSMIVFILVFIYGFEKYFIMMDREDTNF